MGACMRILKDQIQMSTLSVELRQQVPAKPRHYLRAAWLSVQGRRVVCH